MTLTARFALAFCVVALLAPCLAEAQSRSAFSVSAGPVFPIGDFRDTQATGTDVTLAFVRGSDDTPVGLRLSSSFDRLKGKSNSGVANPDRKIVSGVLELIFSLSGYSMKPYFTAGGGAYKMTSTPAVPDAKMRFGYDFAFGVTLPLGGKAFFVEGRLNSVTQPKAKPLRYVPVTLGFLF